MPLIIIPKMAKLLFLSPFMPRQLTNNATGASARTIIGPTVPPITQFKKVFSQGNVVSMRSARALRPEPQPGFNRKVSGIIITGSSESASPSFPFHEEVGILGGSSGISRAVSSSSIFPLSSVQAILRLRGENLPANCSYDGGDKRDQHYPAQAAAYYQSRDGVSFLLIQEQAMQTDYQRCHYQTEFNET